LWKSIEKCVIVIEKQEWEGNNENIILFENEMLKNQTTVLCKT
jgi:hypothetical protein